MAVFTKGEKLCFVSHSGVPYNNDGNNIGFFIPSKIGSNSTFAIQNNKDANVKFIKLLNNEFFDFIKKDIDYKSDEYKKYVAMSAGCGNIEINNTLKLTSEASPVVSNLVITNQYDKRDISLKNLIVKETDNEIKKIYNIYGHVPTGLLPTVRKNEDDNLTSYHIGLDISRAENGGGISNKLSYVYLKIAEKDDTLTGKTIVNVDYDKVIKNTDQTNLEKQETLKKESIIIEYKDLDINTYFDNKIIEKKYHTYENPKEGQVKPPQKPIDGLLYLYTIDNTDNKTFYGMHGYILVKYEQGKVLHNLTKLSQSQSPNLQLKQSQSPNLQLKDRILIPLPPKISAQSQPPKQPRHKLSMLKIPPPAFGGKNNKTYTKSNKRFMNGKRQMVIYLGKRGCEYVKTAGEYVSLTKFIKAINKNKK
jgi:hypothetical protein